MSRHSPPPTPAARPASVTIFVPGLLRHCCAGASTLKVAAADLRGALEQLEVRFPALYRSVCDETGAVRRHVNLFVNSDNSRDLDGIDTTVAEGDVITILPAVSGG